MNKRRRSMEKPRGIAEWNDPPPISVTIPEMGDVKRPSKPCEQSTDVLLLVADEESFLSCFAYFHDAFKSYVTELGHLYFREIGDDSGKILLSLVRCDRGLSEVCSAQNVVRTAVDLLKPKVVFSVGCCAGLQKDKAKLGDVVISKTLVICGDKKSVNDELEWEAASRVNVSRNIGHLIKSAADGWQPPLKDQKARDVRVHCDAEIVTGVDLNNSPKECKDLLRRFPKAIVIESQGQGLYLAAFDRGMEWVIIKGISHFADGSKHETKEWRRFSSMMAASVVNNILNEASVLKDWPRYERANTVQAQSQSADEFDSKPKVTANVSITDLHPSARQELCRKLDQEHILGGDYRTLAADLGMKSDDIGVISQHENKTENVLQWAEQHLENVVKLREILHKMGRHDCVKIIDKEYQCHE